MRGEGGGEQGVGFDVFDLFADGGAEIIAGSQEIGQGEIVQIWAARFGGFRRALHGGALARFAAPQGGGEARGGFVVRVEAIGVFVTAITQDLTGNFFGFILASH